MVEGSSSTAPLVGDKAPQSTVAGSRKKKKKKQKGKDRGTVEEGELHAANGNGAVNAATVVNSNGNGAAHTSTDPPARNENQNGEAKPAVAQQDRRKNPSSPNVLGVLVIGYVVLVIALSIGSTINFREMRNSENVIGDISVESPKNVTVLNNDTSAESSPSTALVERKGTKIVKWKRIFNPFTRMFDLLKKLLGKIRRLGSQKKKRRNLNDESYSSKNKHSSADDSDPTDEGTAARHRGRKKASQRFDFSNAHSTPLQITNKELDILNDYSYRVNQAVRDLHEQAAQVSWGGDQSTSLAAKWWTPVHHHFPTAAAHTELDDIDGGRILWSYYRIMKSSMKNPMDLSSGVRFPFKTCKNHATHPNGCNAEFAIQHTLKWRAEHKPWLVMPSAVKENEDGFVYVHGFSPPHPDHPHYGRHALVWMRIGMHKAVDNIAYFRVILNAVDRSVASALRASHGQVGKFNLIIDATGYEFAKMPQFKYMRLLVTILQDHYPDRLGMIFVANVSRQVHWVISLIRPLLTKEVSGKIHVLSNDPQRLASELETIVDEEDMPDWLGNSRLRNKSKTFEFNSEEFYGKEIIWDEEKGRKFMTAASHHD